MQIEVEVKGQRIKRINSPGSVEDTLNYLTCYFTFDGEEWDNTVKTAYFRNPASGKTYSQILAEDNTCTVPREALTDQGFVKFSVSGERENYRITTDIESFYNGETVYGGEPSEPPTPDQYDQMIALAEQTKEIAESVRRDADEGKFDGDPGEPGKPGAPGRDGVSPTAKVDETDDGAVITVTDATGTTTAKLKNGKDGNPGQNATDEQVRTAVDAYMKEHPIQGDTEDIIKLAIKNEASGEVPVVIADSAEMGVQDIKMQGWTEQAQYEGKNLLPVDVGQEFDGIAVTDSATFEEDGVHAVFESIVSGQARDIYMYGNSHASVEDSYVEVPILTPGDYRLVNDNIGISLYVVAWRNGASVVLGYANNATTKITIQDGDKFRIFLRCNIIGDTDVKIHPMIVKEGEDTTQYEPYTGGQPSPNPDYPQEIVSAGKYNEDTQKWEYEIEFGCGQLAEDSVVSHPEGEYSPDKIIFSGNITGEYTISLEEAGEVSYTYPGAGIIKITINGKDKIVGKDRLPYTFSGNITEITVFSSNSYVGFTGTIEFMLNPGSTPLPYEPYRTPQTVLITSDRPLTKRDRLEKRNGQWGWVYKSNMLSVPKAGYIALDSLAKDRKYFTAVNLVPDSKISSNPREGSQYCNICNLGNPYEYEGNLFWIYRYPENKNGDLRIGLSDTSIDTKELFEQYISDKDIYIWYETEEETFVPLSESEQEQMNDLYTYYPTTVLSNDTECEMSIKYIADTKAYIDNKVSAIQAAIVNAI